MELDLEFPPSYASNPGTHFRARGDIDLNSGTALPTEQTLGAWWNPNDNCFVFALSPALRKTADAKTLMTKRHLLRTDQLVHRTSSSDAKQDPALLLWPCEIGERCRTASLGGCQ